MISLDSSNPAMVFFAILLLLVVISLMISVHEASHAFFANLLGDPTARLLGRMTLNPQPHIDPLGTLVIPLILLIYSRGTFIFGWAKPTPVNPLNLRSPRKDLAIIGAAGPASNFLLAAVFAFFFRILPNPLLMYLVRLNLILAIFNLMPVPTLDGYKILLGFLPKQAVLSLSTLESYGPFILLAFLLLLNSIFLPILDLIISSLTFLLTGST